MKVKILLLLSLCLGLLLLLGYTNLDHSKSTVMSSVDRAQTREVNGLKMTLNEARVDAVNDEDQIVIVDLTLSNISNEILDFSTYKVTLIDGEGYAHNSASDVKVKGILGGQLHPERTNRGEIAFTVPKGTEYELVYTDHLRTGQVTWQVSVEKE